MAITTTSSCRRVTVLAVGVLALVLAGVGCSSDDDAAPAATTIPGSAPGTSVTTAEPTGSTEPIPTSPSTLPESFAGTCAALEETLGLDQIQPQNSSSWVDERQRIVVDAEREAALLATAQQGAPSEIVTRLATMQAYASWLASAIQGTTSYSEAVTATEAYPDMVGMSLAIAVVQTWQNANCPD
jgi:hypothetical protein